MGLFGTIGQGIDNAGSYLMSTLQRAANYGMAVMPTRWPATEEKIKSSPAIQPYFMPFFDELQTAGETLEMRWAYRKMLADPNVKSAFLSKTLGVMALPLAVKPVNRRNQRDVLIANFVQWNLTTRLTEGLPGLIWDVISGGLIDGYSVCEPKWKIEGRGRWRGKMVLECLKAKDTLQDLALVVDEYRNVVGVQALRYNNGTVYSPKDFLIWQNNGLFENPTGMSDFRAAYSPWWFLDTLKKLRAMGAERRALPLIYGEYPDPTKQKSLENALSLIRVQNWLAVPKDVKVQALDIAGRSNDYFESYCESLRQEIFIAIQGATLQALEGGMGTHRGSSDVHKDTADLRTWHLQAAILSLLNRHDGGLIPEMVDRNFVACDEYPTATMIGVDDAELAESQRIAIGLYGMGYDLSVDQIEDTFGWKMPSSESDSLRALQKKSMQMPGAVDANGNGIIDKTAYVGPKGGQGWRDENGKVHYGDPTATQRKAKPGEEYKNVQALDQVQSASGGDDGEGDPEEKLSSIADIVHHVFGDGAGKYVGGEVQKFAGNFDPLQHPRGKDGRFIKKNSAEALAAAKDKVGEVLKKPRSAQTMTDLLEHLNLLTVQQLNDIKKHYQIKASGRNKAELRDKLAHRLGMGRSGDAEAPTQEQPKEQAKDEPKQEAKEEPKAEAKEEPKEEVAKSKPSVHDHAIARGGINLSKSKDYEHGDGWDRGSLFGAYSDEGRSVEEVAKEMADAGQITPGEGETPHDHLLDQMRGRAETTHKQLGFQVDQARDDFHQELKNALGQPEHTDEQIAEAIGRGRENAQSKSSTSAPGYIPDPLAEEEEAASGSRLSDDEFGRELGKHFNYIGRVARSKSKNDHEDLAQEAATKAWEMRSRFDPSKGDMKSWLGTLTRNLHANRVESATAKKRGGGVKTASLDQPNEEGSTLGQSVPDRYSGFSSFEPDEREAVQKAVQSMSPEEQRLIDHYMHSSSYADIGKERGTSAQAAHKAMTKVLNTLRTRSGAK